MDLKARLQAAVKANQEIEKAQQQAEVSVDEGKLRTVLKEFRDTLAEQVQDRIAFIESNPHQTIPGRLVQKVEVSDYSNNKIDLETIPEYVKLKEAVEDLGFKLRATDDFDSYHRTNKNNPEISIVVDLE